MVFALTQQMAGASRKPVYDNVLLFRYFSIFSDIHIQIHHYPMWPDGGTAANVSSRATRGSKELLK